MADTIAHGVSSHQNIDPSFDSLQLETKFAKIDHGASGANEIVEAVVGKKIRVLSYVFVISAAVNVKWQSDTTDLSGAMNFGTKGEGAAPSSDFGLIETAVGEALNLNLSAAIAVDGHISYVTI